MPQHLTREPQRLPKGWVQTEDGWLVCYLTEGWTFLLDVPKKKMHIRVYLIQRDQVLTRSEEFESFNRLQEAIEHCELYKRSGLWKRCPKVRRIASQSTGEIRCQT